MDAARQVLRFSIPGSVVILWTIVLAMFGRYCEGASLSGIFSAVQSNVGALAAILAAIPVGFVVCQIYYIFYREVVAFSRRSPDKRWIRLDRGAQILGDLPDGMLSPIAEYFGVEDLDVEKAHEDVPTFIGKRLRGLRLSEGYRKAHGEAAISAYKKRWRKNWDLMRALIELSEESSGGGAMRAEYTTLSDLYHALGACRTAVQTAWLISMALIVAYVIDGQPLWRSAAAAVAGLLLTAILWWVFHATRRLTWISAKGSLQLGLTALMRRRPDLFEPADPNLLSPHGISLPARIPKPVRDRIHHRVFLVAARLANLIRAGHTAGSLVFIFAEDETLLLVKPTYRRGWGLPGGGMKRGEQSPDAVRRETLEETGIKIDVRKPIEVYVQKKRRHIDHLFLLKVTDKQQPQPQNGAEIADAGWFPLDLLPDLQVEACEALARLKGQARGQSA